MYKKVYINNVTRLTNITDCRIACDYRCTIDYVSIYIVYMIYTVQCIIYHVHYTMYYVHYTVYIVYIVDNVHQTIVIINSYF